MTDTPMHEVALFGTFDTDNFGDCLFPLIVRHQLSMRLRRANVMLFSPTSRRPSTADYGSVHAIDQLPTVCAGRRPAFVIGGGALLATEHVLFSYPEIRLRYPYSLKCWLLPALVAHAWGSPLIFNGVGLGPFDEAFSGLAANHLARAALLGVRDEATARFLNNMKLGAEVVPDSGLLTPSLLSETDWAHRRIELKKRCDLPDAYIVVQASLYLGRHLSAFAAAVADAVQGVGLPVVLLPLCRHLNDVVACRLLQQTFRRRAITSTIIEPELTSLDISAILSKAELFVGTSLHGALVTMAFERPVVSFSLPAMHKNRNVLTAVGMATQAVDKADDLPETIARALTSGVEPMVMANVRERLAAFFDRVAHVVQSQQDQGARSNHAIFTRGRLECEALHADLDSLNKLCGAYKRHVALVRRIGACLVRSNRTASETYDLVVHRARARRAAGGA